MALNNFFNQLFGGGGSVSSSTTKPAVGDTIVRGQVPAGATATLKKNGTVQGAATVTPQGAASYTLGSPLVAGDQVSFPWTLTGESPAAAAAAAPPAAPVNTVLPSISGTAQVGQTLTSSTGTWSNTPTSYTYVFAAGGAQVQSGSGSTYVPQAADVGKTITVAVTAANAGGSGTATSAATSAVTAASQFTAVAGRLFVPNDTLGTTNTYVLAQTHHPMFDAINGLVEVRWPNWRATTGTGTNGGASEILPGAAATASASVTYISATTKQNVTVNLTDATTGSTTLTAADGGDLIGRATINNLAGTDIIAKISANFPNGGVYSHGQADYANGDVLQYGNAAIPLSTTPTNTFAGNRDYYGPSMVAAITNVASIGSIGDSRNSALADVANDRFGNIGPVQRLVGKRIPVVNVSVPGELAVDFAISSQSTRRRGLLAMTKQTRAFYPLLTNDIIFQNRSATQGKSDLDSIVSQIGKSPIYVTLDPATTGGITTPARPANESARLAFNSTVRGFTNVFDVAKTLESSTTPGAWASATYVSNDYTHETNVGNLAAVAGSGFDFSLIGSPTALNLGVDPYPAGALYQTISLADSWNLQGAASIAPASLYGPDHRVSAAVITEDTSTGFHGVFKQPTLTLASTTKTYTFYAKRVSGTRNLFFQVQKSGGNFADGRAIINLANGTVTATQGETGVQTVGSVTVTTFDDYYKVVVPITYASTMPANPYVFFKETDAAGNDQYAGDGASSIAVWGLDIR